jgi:phenylpyruvate tautomerase PptA (4-oxalocrotonate tautomerase family)
MPIAYLDVPDGIQIDEKKKLAKEIYDALHEAYPFPDDVRIFIREWPLYSVSQDGRLGDEPARPVFMMHVPQGISINAVAAAYQLPKFMIFMHEYPLELVSLDGALHADNQARVDAQKKAYSVSEKDLI